MSAYEPMHPEATERLLDAIESRPSLDWLGDERDVDHAIQSAVESWMETEGTRTVPVVDFGGVVWCDIVEGVLARLGLDYDEVFEVTL